MNTLDQLVAERQAIIDARDALQRELDDTYRMLEKVVPVLFNDYGDEPPDWLCAMHNQVDRYLAGRPPPPTIQDLLQRGKDAREKLCPKPQGTT